MKKLFITRKPAELAMAWIQLHCVGVAGWMFYMFDAVVMRWLLLQAGFLAAYMVWVFLFTMSGSRERAEAAKAAQEVTHG
ncbi:MAG: hypothetical protein LBJ15_00780 [Comamonas sp.]|uniref:hypothetical protein n=1 Tax=Comamonas sp. TaxID=34028 RepID=UPI00281F07E2|nr:hypothetical protein [Comamonas sp.]MDR0212521.1 hypothetical protein [Comamonas sp.]